MHTTLTGTSDIVKNYSQIFCIFYSTTLQYNFVLFCIRRSSGEAVFTSGAVILRSLCEVEAAGDDHDDDHDVVVRDRAGRFIMYDARPPSGRCTERSAAKRYEDIPPAMTRHIGVFNCS
jgi:hypothetical protein